MQFTDLNDALDQWLATEGLSPAKADACGIVQFETRGGSSLAAKPLSDGRVELFSSPGWASEQMLRACIDDAGRSGPAPDPAGLTPLLTWRDDGGAEWQVEVRFADGLVVLGCRTQPPASAHEWTSRTEAFERACEGWAARLSPDQVVFHVAFERDAKAAEELSLANLMRI